MESFSSDELYLSWVDILSSHADQLQAHREHRHHFAALEIEHVILYLCAGLSAGILGKYGESIADGTAQLLKKILRRHTEIETSDETKTAAELVIVMETIVDCECYELARLTLINNLLQLGFEENTAEMIASALLDKEQEEEQ